MKSSIEIRNEFINFFLERGHKFVPSSSVIPYDDPTLLFTNAGMNQFKDLFLGKGTRDYKRAVNSQKCIRVSGKHNDLEEVGKDTYHHTFFEMLGNWSFGDYYKKEAIRWAWELLTDVWKLPKDRLYATIYKTDDEAEECWKKETDIEHSHILRFAEKENFWEMGDVGPCGPCSEIHIDLTSDKSGRDLVNTGNPNVIEIWNLVFIQYNREADGSLITLPSKHVDTGAGFERLCAVLQNKNSNYDTDIFQPIIKKICELTSTSYAGTTYKVELIKSNPQIEIDTAIRVISDHIRALAFAIADGALPSNEGRGYVLRRILRRAARYGRKLNMHEPFIYKLVQTLAEVMGNVFPEIKEKQEHIERVIKAEEESFNQTLDRGIEIFEAVINRLEKSKTFPGEDAFKLYDTYGFPIDLTQLMAEERGLHVDIATFSKLMEEQRERARSASKEKFSISNIDENLDNITEKDILVQDYKPGIFVGYETTDIKSKIIRVRKLKDKILIELDKTPFYVESGGQVDDIGYIEYNGKQINVLDVLKHNNEIYHILDRDEAEHLNVGTIVRAVVDSEWRQKTMKNHTATHLLHEALRRVLGNHVQQQGSLVAPDRLRFDFNHFEKLTDAQKQKIEEIVNEKINAGIPVKSIILPLEEAKNIPNIKMFFGEKYGDVVRVIKLEDEFSAELCGGTHVNNTKEIGIFRIISESSIASGIRRIEAVTLGGIENYLNSLFKNLSDITEKIQNLIEGIKLNLSELSPSEALNEIEFKNLKELNTKLPEIINLDYVKELEIELYNRRSYYNYLLEASNEIKKKLSKKRLTDASIGLDEMINNSKNIKGIKVATAILQVETLDELKQIGDQLRDKLKSGIGVLAAEIQSKAYFVCVVTDDLIKEKKLSAGKIISEVAKFAGGSGGGRPHLATAGAKDASKLDEALQKTYEIVKSSI